MAALLADPEAPDATDAGDAGAGDAGAGDAGAGDAGAGDAEADGAEAGGAGARGAGVRGESEVRREAGVRGRPKAYGEREVRREAGVRGRPKAYGEREVRGEEGVRGGAQVGVGVEVYAADIDPAAVACARRNLAAVGGRLYEGDLYKPLPATLRGRVDVLLANVPYVPTGEVPLLPAEARDHEARVALDGGADGLDIARRVTTEAPAWLAPGGHLLFETSDRQVSAALEVVARAGLSARVATCEETDATVIIGTLP
ncbi:hypothetical protein [Actinoallomurus rhizosphaericola]